MNNETFVRAQIIQSDLQRYRSEANKIREIANGLKNPVITFYYYNGHGHQDVASNTQFSDLFPFDWKTEMKVILNDAYDIYLEKIQELQTQFNNLQILTNE